MVAQLEPGHQEPLQPNLPLTPLFSEINVLSMQTDPRLVSCVVIGLAANCGPVLRTILSARQRTMLRETDYCGTRLGTRMAHTSPHLIVPCNMLRLMENGIL